MKKYKLFSGSFFLLACVFFSTGADEINRTAEANGVRLEILKENQNPEDQNKKQNLEEDIKNQNLKVTKINFHGLKKTKNFYIQSKVKKFLNSTVADFDQHGLETALQLEGLFDDIQVSLKKNSETEASAEVSLKEKITFIPIPFAMYSSSGLMGGAMVMDTNAFGTKNMFVVGGAYSESALTGMAIFSKPQQQNWIPGISLSISASKNKTTVTNLDSEEVLKYKAVDFSSKMSISEQAGDFNTFYFEGFFKLVSSSQVENFQKVSPLNSAGVGISWQVSKSDWNGWFMSSCGAGFSAGMTLYSSKSDYDFGKTFSANFNIQKPLINRLRLYSEGSAFYGKDQHISSYRGGGSVSILPGNFRTLDIAGGKAGFEFALFKGKIGTLSVYGDYQAVSARDLDDDFCFMQGPNGGVKVYLAKIAFPALAMGMSYNVTKNYAQFSAAMGISM